MYLIVCPHCQDCWFSDDPVKECKCFRCGKEYTANTIELENWIAEAMKRTKGC